jgi:hypothetical protein
MDYSAVGQTTHLASPAGDLAILGLDAPFLAASLCLVGGAAAIREHDRSSQRGRMSELATELPVQPQHKHPTVLRFLIAYLLEALRMAWPVSLETRAAPTQAMF